MTSAAVPLPCVGNHQLFFSQPGERPPARDRREAAAKDLCRACELQVPCRERGRRLRQYGIWGGETEMERVAAGYGPTTEPHVARAIRALIKQYRWAS